MAFDLSRFSKAWNDYWGALTTDVPFKYQMLDLAEEVRNLRDKVDHPLVTYPGKEVEYDLRIRNISERLNSGYARLNARINTQSDRVDHLDNAVTILGLEKGKRAEEEEQNTVPYGTSKFPKWDAIHVARAANGYTVSASHGTFVMESWVFRTFDDAALFMREVLEKRND